MSETVFNPLTGREADIEVVLQMMCSQEGCDGEPYDQMQAAAELIAKLRAENQALWEALGKIKRVLGPSAPSCDGCATEIGEALKIIEEVVNERA